MVILCYSSFLAHTSGLWSDLSNFNISTRFLSFLFFVAELDLSARGIEQWIPKVFIDPGGRHSIFTVCSSSSADTYYLHGKWRKPRMFSRLKGSTVSSVGWNRAQINEGFFLSPFSFCGYQLVYLACSSATARYEAIYN